jgi:PTH1 family peptidyl-tRNA hydrolase
MKLVVGLGNPGRKYQGTRHNIGFDVLEAIAHRYDATPKKTKFEGDLAEANIGSQRTLLLWPQTYMNLSGASVGKACDFYKIAADDLLVICDDFNLPLSTIRYRASGSAGGQKGLADVIRRLGSDAFCRLRIGVGPVPERWNPADFVLGKFARSEGAAIEEVIARTAESVSVWIDQGIDPCMNQFN